MATFTAEASGALNSDATWAGTGTPGISDQTVNNGFTVTVTANHLTDPDGGHDVGSGGIMEGDAGITLRAGGGRLELTGTAILRHSGTGSGAFLVSQLAGQIIIAAGTDASNRVQILGVDATNHIRFDPGHTNVGTGRIQLDLCDMQFVGNATNSMCTSYLAGTTAYVAYITNSLLNNCGTWNLADAMNDEVSFKFNNNNCTACLDDLITMSGMPAANTTGTREIIGNYADRTLTAAGSTQNYNDFTVTGNALVGVLAIASGTGLPTEVSGNLFAKTGSGPHSWASSFDDNYWVQSAAVSNPHFHSMAVSVTGTIDIDGNIYDDSGTAANGDGFLVPAGAGVAHFNIVRNIACRTSAGGISCTVVSALGHDDKTWNADHNSFWTAGGAVGIQGGETEPGVADNCTSGRSNLAIGPATTGLVFGSGGSPVDGYFTVGDFSTGWSTTGEAFTDNYGPADAKFGTAPGANDVNVDPQLVDHERNLAVWDLSLGGAGTYANALAELALMNTATHDAGYTPAAAHTYVKAGWAPQNATVQNAGHDGVTIGAVEFVAGGVTGAITGAALAGDALAARTDFTAARTDAAVVGDTQAARTDFATALAESALAGEATSAEWGATASQTDTAVVGDAWVGTLAGPFVSDTFSGESDATALTDHTGETGATWTGVSGAHLVSAAGRVYPQGIGASYSKASGSPASAEYDVEADLVGLTTVTGQQIGVFGRLVDFNNHYWADGRNGAGLRLWKSVAGALTQLGSYSTTVDGSYAARLKFEIRDGAKKVYEDDVERISSADNALTAAGSAGIRTSVGTVTPTTGIHLDNFTATDAAATGETGDITEGAQVGDSFVARTDFTAATADGALASDALAADWTATASRADAAVMSDAWVGTLAGALTGSLSETVLAADAWAVTWGASASRTDQATAGDTFGARVDLAAAIADTATVGDTQTSVWTAAASRADAATAGDAFSVGWTATGSLAETATAGETQTAQWAANASQSDAALAGDVEAASWTATATTTDTALVGDSLGARVDWSGATSDAVVVGDTFAGSLSGEVTGAIGDTVLAGEAFAPRADWGSSRGDGVLASATFDALLVTGRQIAEGVIAGDAISVTATLTVVRSEQAVMGDSFSASMGGGGTLSADLVVTFWLDAFLAVDPVLDGAVSVDHGGG